LDDIGFSNWNTAKIKFKLVSAFSNIKSDIVSLDLLDNFVSNGVDT